MGWGEGGNEYLIQLGVGILLRSTDIATLTKYLFTLLQLSNKWDTDSHQHLFKICLQNTILVQEGLRSTILL
jgi:hypothetical protein